MRVNYKCVVVAALTLITLPFWYRLFEAVWLVAGFVMTRTETYGTYGTVAQFVVTMSTLAVFFCGLFYAIFNWDSDQ